MTKSVTVVGASVAGVGAVNELRRCGYTDAITLIDAQPHLPYDRPPLSKAALGGSAIEAAFHEVEHYVAHKVTLKLGAPATGFDASTRTVTLATGEMVTADTIILAPGARAKRLPAKIARAPVHVIRDLDDAAALRPLLQPGKHLVMIGGGFIGAEVAATARRLGLEVTIIDRCAVPLAEVLGTPVAERLRALHTTAGVNMVCEATVSGVETIDGRQEVSLADGATIAGDIVVAGIGSAPNIEWLAGSGVSVGNGILCDSTGHTSAPGVFAAGDAAAWQDPRDGQHHRHEHWTAAREQARIVAQVIAGVDETQWKLFVPYFWSDMHGQRIQLLGESTSATRVDFVFENPATGAFVAEYRRGDQLVGVVGCNAAGRVMRYAARLAG